MNYLFGFLFLTIKDEKVTFDTFISLVEKFFPDFFSKEMRKLKILFYQFDQCLNLFLPELAEHFKVNLNKKLFILKL